MATSGSTPRRLNSVEIYYTYLDKIFKRLLLRIFSNSICYKNTIYIIRRIVEALDTISNIIILLLANVRRHIINSFLYTCSITRNYVLPYLPLIDPSLSYTHWLFSNNTLRMYEHKKYMTLGYFF